MALWMRGAEPTLMLCDGVLPACEACEYVLFPNPDRFIAGGPQRELCGRCFATGREYYGPLPLALRRYSEFVEHHEPTECLATVREFSVDECFSFEHEGLRLGEQTRAATLRFFGKADLSSEPGQLVESAARRFAAGALVAAHVAERVIAAHEPECVVAHHGVYIPQGVLGEVARREGIRVVHWGPSYRNTTVIFSHGDTYHRTFINEPVELWDRPLTPDQEATLMDYLAKRSRGEGDWTWVTPEAGTRREVQQRERLLHELNLDASLPIVGLLTNVLWDAQLYYAGHAFPDMLEWLWTTLDRFSRRSDLQLIVRIHPHEVKQGNRQPVEPEIRARFPNLPNTIKIVPHDHPYNTYALMRLCKAVLIYGTKTGVELAPLGMPVVVAGDAWIRGKGLTHDARTPDEYDELIDRLPNMEPLNAETTQRARRYAYHYFFRRMIPLNSLDPDGGVPPRLRIERPSDLLPGNDPGLDTICGGILDGTPFSHDA
jgi:Capsule polysaccharide biosynthesis protein